jgi:hypothetical protein
MKRIVKRLERLLNVGARVLGCAAVLVKLLIPVGYMPAALASGAPIRLCDGYVPVPLQAMAHPGAAVPTAGQARAGQATAGHATAGHAMAGHAMADMPHSIAAGGTPAAGAGAPSDDDLGGHHEHQHGWEHCSLGALAASAAIASDWPLVFSLPPAADIEAAEESIPASLTVAQARARGPPTHA